MIFGATPSHAQPTPECYAEGICKLPADEGGGETKMTVVPEAKTRKCRAWKADADRVPTLLTDARQLREERDQCQGAFAEAKADERKNALALDEKTATIGILRERNDRVTFRWWHALLGVGSGALLGTGGAFALDADTRGLSPYLLGAGVIGSIWLAIEWLQTTAD